MALNLEELIIRKSPNRNALYHVIKPGMANQELKL